MAKKRATRKPRGTDAGGQPLDLSSRSQYMDQVDRMVDSSNSARKAAERNQPASARLDRREVRVAARNVRDFQRNAPTPRSASDIRGVASNKGPFSMGPAKGDKLSGRTVEAGTRSLREGMRSWMRDLRGGGGSRLTGR